MKRSLFILTILVGFCLSGCGDCFLGHKESIGGIRYLKNGIMSPDLILEDDIGYVYELTWMPDTRSELSTDGLSGRLKIDSPGFSISLRTFGTETDLLEMLFCHKNLCEIVPLRASQHDCIKQDSTYQGQVIQSCISEFDIDFSWVAPEEWGYPLMNKEFFVSGTIHVEGDEVSSVSMDKVCVAE